MTLAPQTPFSLPYGVAPTYRRFRLSIFIIIFKGGCIS
jgi:hypothetical protein